MPDVFDVRSEVWNCLSGAAWIVTLCLEGSECSCQLAGIVRISQNPHLTPIEDAWSRELVLIYWQTV